MRFVWITSRGAMILLEDPRTGEMSVEAFRSLENIDQSVQALMERPSSELLQWFVTNLQKNPPDIVQKVFAEDPLLVNELSNALPEYSILKCELDEARRVSQQIENFPSPYGLDLSSDDQYEHVRHVALTLSKEHLVAGETRDVYLAQAVQSIDELNKNLNLITSRLTEWYGVHFPELRDLVRDHGQYLRLIATIGPRSRFSMDLLHELKEQRASVIIQASEVSLGSELASPDMVHLQEMAQHGLDIIRIRERLQSYVENSMNEIAPNTSALVGPLLGARLIAHAGSLKALAKLPSSTIQVLGAERAFFRHLRTGERPPKHGIIFQSPYIHQAKKHHRGRLARALANKIALAARIDYFTGEFYADELKSELDQRKTQVERIPAPPPEKKKKPSRKFKKRRKTSRK